VPVGKDIVEQHVEADDENVPLAVRSSGTRLSAVAANAPHRPSAETVALKQVAVVGAGRRHSCAADRPSCCAPASAGALFGCGASAVLFEGKQHDPSSLNAGRGISTGSTAPPPSLTLTAVNVPASMFLSSSAFAVLNREIVGLAR
jgi:hypothetical protein